MSKATSPRKSVTGGLSRRSQGKPKVAAALPTVSRRSVAGDIAPSRSKRGIESFVVGQAIEAAETAKLAAVRDVLSRKGNGDAVAHARSLREILEGAAPDDAAAIRAMLEADAKILDEPKRNPDEELAIDWRDGGYPYKNLMTRKNYEKQKYRLQVELLKLQSWVKNSGQKVVILFEGRDAAGKGGTIKRFMEHRFHIVHAKLTGPTHERAVACDLVVLDGLR